MLRLISLRKTAFFVFATNGKELKCLGKRKAPSNLCREMRKNQEQKVSGMQAYLDKSAKTEKGREKLRKGIGVFQVKCAYGQVNYKLEPEGCQNVKVACGEIIK